ncbi:MAG: hypothetical protein AABY22_03035 [Nanoarchaeota archaeon]
MLIQSNKEIIREINNKPFDLRNTKIFSYNNIVETDLSGEVIVNYEGFKFNGLIVNDYRDKQEIEVYVYNRDSRY